MLLAVFMTANVFAGDFTVTAEDSSSISVEYYGDVYRYDYQKWDAIEALADGRVILLTINTYGGSAYGGFDLYWAIEETSNVVTICGSKLGAWSAGAIMWLAGDHKLIEKGGVVGFHRAFCNWDPRPFPDIGCDVSDCDDEMDDIFIDAGLTSKMTSWLITIQWSCGTDGWIEIRDDLSWWLVDSSDDREVPFDKEEVLR